VKYHTKPFQCQVTGCGYSCGRPQGLKCHEHGAHKGIFGIEEYPCPHEERQREGLKYSRRDNLLRYLSKRHGGDDEEDSGLP
jgi:hypothetical protein